MFANRSLRIKQLMHIGNPFPSFLSLFQNGNQRYKLSFYKDTKTKYEKRKKRKELEIYKPKEEEEEENFKLIQKIEVRIGKPTLKSCTDVSRNKMIGSTEYKDFKSLKIKRYRKSY